MKPVHLHYDCMGSPIGDDYMHPEKRMKSLGITYQDATPQSMYDCWQFWNCENVPDDLPPYIKIRDYDPMKFIMNGLSQENAEKIRDYEK